MHKIIKVVNAGNCMMCGRPIETTDCNTLDIFFCKECAEKAEYKEKEKITENDSSRVN